MAGAGEPDGYVLAAPDPKVALLGVNSRTALHDRRVFDLLRSAVFYRGRAEIAVQKASAKEPMLHRMPPWPRGDA